MNTPGIILCGGLSRRMGIAKDTLPIRGQTYLQRIQTVLSAICAPIIVSTRPNQALSGVAEGTIIISDRIQGVGPLGGLEASLRAAADFAPIAVVIGCDYPLIEPGFLRLLLAAIGEHDAAMPEVHGRLHPLAACYKTSLAGNLAGFLETRAPRVLDFVATVRARILSEKDLTEAACSIGSLTNVNTPAEHLAIVSHPAK